MGGLPPFLRDRQYCTCIGTYPVSPAPGPRRPAHRTIAAFAFWALTLAGLACPGQPTTTGAELAETAEPARLVDLSAQRLGLNIEYDAKLAGPVVLRLGSQPKVAESQTVPLLHEERAW